MNFNNISLSHNRDAGLTTLALPHVVLMFQDQEFLNFVSFLEGFILHELAPFMAQKQEQSEAVSEVEELLGL